jgi:1-acyl-sn-glycerol-3-phosphate acyltransferase
MKIFYKFIFWLLRIFLKKPEVIGLENIEEKRAAVFISNHLGYYAPLKVMLFSNIRLYPWVISEVTDSRLCGEYIRRDFVEPTLKLRGFLGKFVAGVLAPLCVGLMRYVEAIAVYHGSNRIKETFELSVKYLSEGRSLLIFPEVPNSEDKFVLGDFQSGFVKVAKDYYDYSGDSLVFYPVYVNKIDNKIIFGEGMIFDSTVSFREERIRISALLRDKMVELSSI